ncbi:MAG: alpha/beta hydrolase [Gammaproteobacteria bacterium]
MIRKALFAVVVVIVVVIAAVLLLAYSGFRRDLDDAQKRIAAGSELVDTPCGVIEYTDVGSGPPLLIIHGAGGGFDQSLAVGRPLIENGFRIIAPSRFGYLRTPLPADATPMAQADAHACLLDALGLERVAVVGASLGAPSAVQLCLRHPKRCNAMVLVVPVLHSPQGTNEFLQRALNFVRRTPDALLGSDLGFWLATRFGGKTLTELLIGVSHDELRRASTAEQERIRGMIDLALPISARARGVRNDVSIALPRYALDRIDAPTLIVSVESDLYGTFDIARYTAGQIPGARLLRYATGGHLWVGHHEDMPFEVATFLRGARSNLGH